VTPEEAEEAEEAEESEESKESEEILGPEVSALVRTISVPPANRREVDLLVLQTGPNLGSLVEGCSSAEPSTSWSREIARPC
jgi:hypothetical protein